MPAWRSAQAAAKTGRTSWLRRRLLNLLTLDVRASWLGAGRFLVAAVGGDAEMSEPPSFTVLDYVPHLRLNELLELREQPAHTPAAAGGAGGGLAPANPAAALHPQRELIEDNQHDDGGCDDEEYCLRQLSTPCFSLVYDLRNARQVPGMRHGRFRQGVGMKRRLVNLLTILSLLLCVAVCALWVRSYVTQDAWWYIRASAGPGWHLRRSTEVGCNRGEFVVSETDHWSLATDDRGNLINANSSARPDPNAGVRWYTSETRFYRSAGGAGTTCVRRRTGALNAGLRQHEAAALKAAATRGCPTP
jgi:hypothetical protein